MAKQKEFDVIIVGGSYAGLSAAMSLGRSLRSVLIIDSGVPCNRQTPHSHNFLTQDGKTPQEIFTLAKRQVEQYDTVTFHSGVAATGAKSGDRFSITTIAGDTFLGKKLVFATGIKDSLPGIAGATECWGISLVHCPYCHGYEYRHQKTGILANGEAAMHYAQLVSNLTKDLTIFTNGEATFTPEQYLKLAQHNIQIVATPVAELQHEKGYLQQVLLSDGKKVSLDAMYYRPDFVQHCDIPVALGCELTEQGHIKIDQFHQTTIPGVFACGDSTSPMRAVANAVAGGNFTGAVVNKELTEAAF